MSNIDPRILAKIKKCLALGSSPNPNEAATAMRQAAALMRQHGVDAHNVTMAEIDKSTAKVHTMSRDKPANWEAALASTVAKAFGCQVLIRRNTVPKQYRHYLNEGQFIFIGQKGQSEVAAYTVDVLARKCKAARQKWFAQYGRELGSVLGGRGKTTRMGDAFAEGWVAGIDKLVANFANPPGIAEAIDRHIFEMNVGDSAPTRKINADEVGLGERFAAAAGIRAASGESLYRPMSAKAPNQAIEHAVGGG
jgi:hypothetical protein